MVTVYTETEEAKRNPLLSFNRNTTCFICDSGKKLKKCCGKHRYIPQEFYEEINKKLELLGDEALDLVR